MSEIIGQRCHNRRPFVVQRVGKVQLVRMK